MKGSIGMSQGIPCFDVSHETAVWTVELNNADRPRVGNLFALQYAQFRIRRAHKARSFLIFAGEIPSDQPSALSWRASTLRLTTWVAVACNGGVYVVEEQGPFYNSGNLLFGGSLDSR